MATVVHFGKYYPPDFGGIESVTTSLANGATKANHSVSVICFSKVGKAFKEFIDGVTVYREPTLFLLSSQPVSIKYVIRCLKAAKKADIVHLHTPNMFGALCALLINRKVKLIVHWHSDVINKGILASLLKPLENALLSRADAIIATSEAYVESSNILHYYSNKISVVPIGVPDASIKGLFEKLPNYLQDCLEGKSIILSVGRLVPYKGFDVLIKAAQFISNDVVIVIVGDGPLKHSLELLVSKLDLKRRVFFTGKLKSGVLNTLFRNAKIFCLPSIHKAEAFGVVLLEAMAYGLPVVATNIPGSGVPWVNKHGVSGLNVEVSDHLALADSCNFLINSNKYYESISVSARARYLNEFTEDIFVRRVLGLYKKLISDR